MSSSNDVLRLTLRFLCDLSKGTVRTRLVAGAIAATLLSASGAFRQDSMAQTLAPVNVFADRYHADVYAGVGASTRFGAFQVVTNGLASTIESGPSQNHFDTFNGGNPSTTFVGLDYGTLVNLNTVTVDLGPQWNNGASWVTQPNVYILTNNVDTNNSSPQSNSNWTLVPSATLSSLTTPAASGNMQVSNSTVFNSTGVQDYNNSSTTAPNAAITFSLPAGTQAYGFAVGGVQGSGGFAGNNAFISITSASAQGSYVGLLTPSNVVASTYHAPFYNGTLLGNLDVNGSNRADAFSVATNGIVSHGGVDAVNSFDTCCGHPDSNGSSTFAGLLYSHQEVFSQVIMQVGQQYGDGGNFASTPSLYVLVNPVDTNTTSPTNDPTDWKLVSGATLVVDASGSNTPGGSGPGWSYTFDLNGVTASLRTGYGWAIVGQGSGGNDFLSVSQLEGFSVPEPSSLALSGVAGAIGLGLLARRRCARPARTGGAARMPRP